jgi:hypothetical protein
LPSSTASPLGYPVDDAQWRRRLASLRESAKFDRAALRDAVRGARHAAARQAAAEAEAEARGQQTVEATARALRAEEQLRALEPAAYRLGEMEQQARDRVGRRVREAASPAHPAHPRYQAQGSTPHRGSPQGPAAEGVGSRRLSDVDGFLDSPVTGAGPAEVDARSSAAPPAAAARARAARAAAAASAAAPAPARARALLAALQQPGGADAGLAPTPPSAPPPTRTPLDDGVAAQAAKGVQPAVVELGFFERVGSFFGKLQAEREQAAAAEREAAAAERAAAVAELEDAVALAEAEEQASVRRRSSAIAIQRRWIRTTSSYAGQAEPGTSLAGFTGEISPPSPRSARDLTV